MIVHFCHIISEETVDIYTLDKYKNNGPSLARVCVYCWCCAVCKYVVAIACLQIIVCNIYSITWKLYSFGNPVLLI